MSECNDLEGHAGPAYEGDPDVKSSFVNAIQTILRVSLDDSPRKGRFLHRRDARPIKISANLLGFMSEIADEVMRSEAAVIQGRGVREPWKRPGDMFRRNWNVVDSVFIDDQGHAVHQKAYWRRGLFGRLHIAEVNISATDEQLIEARDTAIDAAFEHDQDHGGLNMVGVASRLYEVIRNTANDSE